MQSIFSYRSLSLKALFAMMLVLGLVGYATPAYALFPWEAWDLTSDLDNDGDPDPDRGTEITMGSVEGTGGLREYVEALDGAVNVTITMEIGVYSIVNGPIQVGSNSKTITGLTIRGPDNTSSSATFSGGNLVDYLFEVWNASDFRMANLRMMLARTYLVYLHGETSINAAHFYHCYLFDSAEGMIVADGSYNDGVSYGKVEYCTIGYTNMASLDNSLGAPFPELTKTKGVWVKGGINWVIRHNLFFWMCFADGAAEDYPTAEATEFGVLVQNGSSGTEVSGNTFDYCECGIAFGLTDMGSQYESKGGLIKNNFFYKYEKRISYGQPMWPGWLGDYPQIWLVDAEDTHIYHNSLWHDPASTANITISPLIYVDLAGSHSGLEIKNNLTNAFLVEGAVSSGTYPFNYQTTEADGSSHYTFVNNNWLYDPMTGKNGTWNASLSQKIRTLVANLHLRAGTLVPSALVDQCNILADECPEDFDNGYRSTARPDSNGGSKADFGADEYQVGRPPQPNPNAGGGGGKPCPPLPRRTLTSNKSTIVTYTEEEWQQVKGELQQQDNETLRDLVKDGSGSALERLRAALEASHDHSSSGGGGSASSTLSAPSTHTKGTSSGGGAGLGN